MNDKSVAAIIPTRNRAEQLENALDSVLEQTYKNITIIVVDDGSTDGTSELIKKYQEKTNDMPVKRIRNDKSHGPTVARNQALRMTEADFIAFLDDDDIWHPNKIARQIEKFRDNKNLSVIYTGKKLNHPDSLYERKIEAIVRDDMYEELLTDNIVTGGLSSIMIRKKSIEHIDGFDEELYSAEDWDLYIRLARDYEFGCIPDILVTINLHPDQVSSVNSSMDKCEKHVLKKHREDLERLDILNSAWEKFHIRKGRRHIQARNLKKTREEFQKAVKIQPGITSIMLYMSSLIGVVKMMQGVSILTEKYDRFKSVILT